MKVKTPDTEIRSDNLRLYFILWLFLLISLSVGLASLLTLLIEWLTQSRVVVPTIVWMILLSIALGLALSATLSNLLISPVLRLSRAMQQVAHGDFTVRLGDAGHFGEMRQSYRNFNTMVEALGATETLQSNFVSNVSHEFKTPINAIEGYAMLMQDADPALQKEYAEKILYSTRRLGDLVNNILLLSKVENQTIPAEKAPYRLDEQLRHALLLLERKWTEKELELDVDLAPITYTGNESLMLHVWTNLIDNAIKFNEKGGLLRLSLTEEDSSAVIKVADSGAGMTEEEIAHIFDRFYQADGSHRGEGNGLGLALAQRIVSLSGGEISVESVPGHGSCFTVSLPEN